MNIAIVGATGYSGIELLRLLLNHPEANLTYLISNSQSNKQLSEVYPHFSGVKESMLKTLDIPKVAKEVDVVFFATPSGVSKNFVPEFLEYGVKCIDLSGDFRLKDPLLYEKWYKNSSASEKNLEKAVYGLSEIYENDVKEASLIANPGCYPTATLLGLLPALKEKWIKSDSIIIDGKSGVSGAGRSVSIGTHFAETNENLKAYKLGSHQHIPEIEQILHTESGIQSNVTFSTHLVPMTRGIMCTMYADLQEHKSTGEIIDLYKQFYEGKPFVRIRPEDHWPTTKEVSASNYCDIGFMSDARTGRLTIVSVIDNVVKGAAGQAVQNLNIMMGLDAKTGLNLSPVYP
ncbi:N-acetyl-gamma-glutamyl-phosphate reductase [Pseudalkalibacillus caeni]|uniref:N-acetyl-gamma-glutamyl-phosphate reductase n=1 Tax=Exobacillus caeni TaxID=2574798 RepID=A0A5R9F7P2_9BACL|nr:N-acetyl-gamma-glutamyl-phosphate reductase [Pseudalkalibacillus caeni]TLS36863.1 N-acetyl-gamma-glutamyl-phosphate reductase [Pseudalkalibacillus caeni]